ERNICSKDPQADEAEWERGKRSPFPGSSFPAGLVAESTLAANPGDSMEEIVGKLVESAFYSGAGKQAGKKTPEPVGSDIGGYLTVEPPTDTAPKAADPGTGYIFEHTRGKKCLIFTNSREECESVCQHLRQYCEANHEPDRFLIHHGNLSASYRESAEDEMRDEDSLMSVCATATLELGIDIGKLERAFQIDAPFTVSGFLQRMGRTGRRGDPSEMWFVMREDHPEPRAMFPEMIPWYMIQGIALVQLYIEERFVEPPRTEKLPFSLLYHQTMSTLASCGEMTPAELALRVLTLSVFRRISRDDFRLLLRHLLEIDHISRTENGGLIVGLTGERIVNDYKFFAVFQENIEYSVRADSQELGTIVKPPPAGEKIAIAGRVWIVDEVDHKHRKVYCTLVKGNIPAYFGDVAGDIHTRILERMRGVLSETKNYPYLMRHAVYRLREARETFARAGMDREPLIHLGGKMWALFPWLGSYAFLALERFLKLRCGKRLGLKGMNPSRPYCLQFTMQVSAEDFYKIVKEEAEADFDPMELVYPKEVPVFEKYDAYVPPELVRKGFALGVLDIEGMKKRVREWGAASAADGT
ncbi:MAG: helicase-related protein, partial [Eubacteriales bacterium]|nr:helicase-related protein [Eubacteriales bacterium]